MYLVKSPLLLKWFYPMLTWNKSRKEKIVYLTFDDGPIPNVTTFVLNTLKEHDIRATFFCIGDNIDRHPDVFEAIKADGHSIGNHTYNHLNGWKTDTETYINNVLKCQKLTQSNLFRPPYGRIKPSQVKALQSVFSSQFSVPTTPTENGKLLTSNSQLPTPNSQLPTTDYHVGSANRRLRHPNLTRKMLPERYKSYQKWLNYRFSRQHKGI